MSVSKRSGRYVCWEVRTESTFSGIFKSEDIYKKIYLENNKKSKIQENVKGDYIEGYTSERRRLYIKKD